MVSAQAAAKLHMVPHKSVPNPQWNRKKNHWRKKNQQQNKLKNAKQAKHWGLRQSEFYCTVQRDPTPAWTWVPRQKETEYITAAR